MAAYYNEFDKKAAAWLRELIKAKLIAPGEVDERSIADVRPDDLKDFTQCHFFAGIGGWSRALRLAGWPDDCKVWTGSCPCQCFSVAGKGEGTSDHRDLWPVFARLIAERKPTVVFGEQVAAAIGYGWFDRLRTDLEKEGYAVGGHVLGAHSVGADHIRNRLYWVADAGQQQCEGREIAEKGQQFRDGDARSEPASCNGESCGLGYTDSAGCGELRGAVAIRPQQPAVECAGFWDNSKLILCRDGKTRRIPVESELFPLAHGIPGRVGLLRGAGNAIVPQVAEVFIRAFHDWKKGE